LSLFNELKRRNVFRVGAAYVVVAWLTLQVADVVLNNIEAPGWVFRVIMLMLAIGLPFVLIFAWAFELTPDGLKREHEVDRTESITPKTGRKLDFTIIAVLVLALGYFAYDKFVLSGDRDAALVEATSQAVAEQSKAEPATPEQPERSIAVLPFVNMSSDVEQEYFSDGISEEILNVLTKIPGLHVTSRSSAFAFKGKEIDIPTVAAQLGVSNVLEGSVRKSGTKIRITAQLIEAESDRHLWSETYDRELDDIFAIQDEISAAIVNALKGHLELGSDTTGTLGHSYTGNTEAYEAYLRGRHLIVQRTRPGIEAAVKEFSEAIRLDPQFARAHAELAIAYILLTNNQYGDYTFSEAQALAIPHADRAMELDPSLAIVQAAAGMVLWNIGAPPETMAYLEESLRINPNQGQVLIWLGIAIEEQGESSKVLPIQERLLRLDPLSIPNLSNLAGSYAYRGRFDDSESVLAKLKVLSPSAEASSRASTLSAQAKFADSAFSYLQALQFEPQNTRPRRFLGFQLADMGLDAEVYALNEDPEPDFLWLLGSHEEAIRKLTEKNVDTKLTADDMRYLGNAYAATGDYAKARPLLEEVWEQSGRRVVPFGAFSPYDAAALIVARQHEDPTADTHDLLDAMKASAHRLREAEVLPSSLDILISDGLYAWFSGDRTGAIEVLDSAVAGRSFIPPNLNYLKDLLADPGFAKGQEKRMAHSANERQKFLAVVCADSPYADVWEPLPESCMGVAGEQMADGP
jgi:TolB-like protein/Flp pilus assembly protein TadD